ncbi:MAG: cytochrome c oxidase subunit II [Thermoanaerobaculia bacterium]|nr:cytochrome c oxidase subunit II [Thermoanaerobaculia bacterium]
MSFKLPFFPEQASSLAGEVDALTLWLVGMSAFFTLLIAVLVVVFALRYRRRTPDQVGARFDESALLEITWTVIPLVIVLFTFAWGAKVYFRLYRPPAGAVEYGITGKQWMWKVQHPTGQREINELHLPVGQATRLTMTSEDVIHSFFVPAFRVKADVIPGRYTTMWFKPTKPGRYRLFCTEYCGTEHSRMIGWVVVQEPEEYQRWLASVPVVETLAQQGRKIYERLGCEECHAAGSELAPSLAGLFGRDVQLANGTTVRADETYLRESILDPDAKLVAGYDAAMSSYRGQAGEEELLALIGYLKSLPAATAAVGDGSELR